jgi:hypothetical protein
MGSGGEEVSASAVDADRGDVVSGRVTVGLGTALSAGLAFPSRLNHDVTG